MTYTPPLDQILRAIKATAVPGAIPHDSFSDDDAEMVLNEAARFAAQHMAPLNKQGDHSPAQLVNGKVVTTPAWQNLYDSWCAAGWNSLSGPVEHGGQGLPFVLAVACTELWNAACMSLALCPLLTTGAIEAINAHASEELKQRYLPKLILGEWSGTMNLTEPQAGSDLSELRCKAKRHEDGSYRITGSKIYITYGDHDLTSNIIHLVLARLEDAPPGTKGISLFLVPKILPDGKVNDMRCQGLERKLGIHAAPTCTMVYGDEGGATGWLVGDENRGLNCMFTMMNNARVLVAVQGVAIASRALEAATTFATGRRQGRGLKGGSQQSLISDHPDVKRMLLEMRVKTRAARMLCMATAAAIDAGSTHAWLLTPLAKAYATDIAVEVASTAIQVHGGMGFIEDTGVAQFYRDARILPIYEGTNGIQAIDFITRKLGLENGETVKAELVLAQQALESIIGQATTAALMADMQHITATITSLDPAQALAAASPVTRCFASFIAAGYLAKASPLHDEAEIDARYFSAVELPTAIAHAKAALAAAPLIVGQT